MRFRSSYHGGEKIDERRDGRVELRINVLTPQSCTVSTALLLTFLPSTANIDRIYPFASSSLLNKMSLLCYDVRSDTPQLPRQEGRSAFPHARLHHSDIIFQHLRAQHLNNPARCESCIDVRDHAGTADATTLPSYGMPDDVHDFCAARIKKHGLGP